MEYYRSIRGNPAPFSRALRALKQTRISWKNKKRTLNQPKQRHCSSWLQHLSSPLHWRIASPLVKISSDAAAQARSRERFSTCSGQHTLRAAGSTGCGGEKLSWLASLCPASSCITPLPGLLLLGFAATSGSHIQTSLHLCEAGRWMQLTPSRQEPGQELACFSQPVEPRAKH